MQKTGNGAEWEKNDIIFTEFKEWSITHTWARESSNIYKTTNTWYDMVQYDTIEYEIESQLLVWYDKIWYDICFIMFWYDIKYGIASYWYDMIYHMIWYTVWCYMIWCEVQLQYIIWFWYDVYYDIMIWNDIIDMIHDTIVLNLWHREYVMYMIYAMIRYDMIRYDMIYEMMWYDMICPSASEVTLMGMG